MEIIAANQAEGAGRFIWSSAHPSDAESETRPMISQEVYLRKKIACSSMSLNSAAPYQVSLQRLMTCQDIVVRELVCAITAVTFEIDVLDIVSRHRGAAKIAFARQVAMYLCHVVAQQSQQTVGQLFDRDRKTVSHACLVIEERRDNQEFDALLDKIEMLLWSFLRAFDGLKQSEGAH